MSRKTLGMGLLAATIWVFAAAEGASAKGIALPPPPANLTLSEALARAMRDSPEVQIAESELRRMEGEANSQALWPLRSVTANVSIVRQLNGGAQGLAPGQTPGAVGFGGPTAGAYLTMNVGELIGGLHLRQAALARVETARQNVRQVKLEVATGLTEAYAAWAAQKKLMALRQEAIKASQSDVVTLERLFGRGGASLNDLLRARLAYSQSQADLATAEGDYQRTWTALLQRMGDATWLEAGAASGAPKPAK